MAAWLVLVAGACGRPPAPSSLLLITVDTLRADRIGAYGAIEAETPHLDALAQAGIRFAQVQSAVPLTLPAHATLLTGRLPIHHGLRSNGLGRLPSGVTTLAEVLTADGWRTGAFVGAFVLDRRFGLARGFEHYDDDIARPIDGRALRLESERRASAVVDRALAWLRDDDERPFFAWVHLYDPHAPYGAPSPWRERFADRPYDGEVAYVDAEIGRLLDGLEETASVAQTLVAVAADHGESLGAHGEASHGVLLHEAVLQVPWILRGSGVPAGEVVAEPVGIADIGPTLAGLLGRSLGIPDDLPGAGRDLTPTVRRGVPAPRTDLYAETEYPAQLGWAPLRAVRRGALKLVRGPRARLFDLHADPEELDDRAHERRRDVHTLGAVLDVFEAQVDQAPRASEAVDAETRSRLAALGYVGELGVASSPDAADPHDRVGLLTVYEAAYTELLAGRPAPAAEGFRALVEEEPENPVFLAALGRARLALGEPEAAVEAFRDAVAARPDDPGGWYDLASALRDAGQPRRAFEAIEMALQHDPERPHAFNLRGVALLALGEVAEAERSFDRAVALDARDAMAWNNLANARRALGRLAEAEAAYRRAATLAPHSPDAWNGLGTLAVEQDRAADAVDHFDRALALQPSFHEARLNRGIALQLQGDLAGAAQAYREVMDRADEAQASAATTLLRALPTIQ